MRLVVARPPLEPDMDLNSLDQLDPALGCSGVMSILSYDSHPVSRRRNCDELPRLSSSQAQTRSDFSLFSCHETFLFFINVHVATFHTKWTFFPGNPVNFQ